MKLRTLGGLTAAQFLKRHWQKKPLLVRRAFPDFKDIVTPDELAGLALEKEASSRLIRERGGTKPWQVTHGPQKESVLRGLPKSHWTLLVSRVNDWVKEGSKLLEPFQFIPEWRLDDLMVSFAPEMGTVGPHVDQYDVFLIQGMGRRRWQIQESPRLDLRPGLELKILKHFRPEEEWILEPGDMLYLPPGVAHHGVALEPTLTYSVGFRAPSMAQMMLELLGLDGQGTMARVGDRLYEDPDLAVARPGGEISPDALAVVRREAEKLLQDDELLSRWFGAFVTRPDDRIPLVQSQRAPRDLSAKLKRQALWRQDRIRMAWALARGSKNKAEGPQSKVLVFVGGEERQFSASQKSWVEYLGSKKSFAPQEILKELSRDRRRRAESLDLLSFLVQRGAFFFDAHHHVR